MRLWALAIFASLWPAMAPGQDLARQAAMAQAAEVDAARQRAVEILIQQIEPRALVPGMTVGQFLDRTGGRGQFRRQLLSVDPVGGPRWPNEQTCQVRLDISGTEVVADLANIAVAEAARAPMPASDLVSQAGDLSSQWFSATGTSVAAGAAPAPLADNPWDAVPPEVRHQMIHRAVEDAAQRILGDVAPIQLTADQRIGDAIAAPAIGQSLMQWLTDRPITSVEYLRDESGRLVVRVELAADGAELCDILRTALTAGGENNPATDWASVRQEIIGRAGPEVGRAILAGGPAAPALVLPQLPPDWTNGVAEASGFSPPVGNPLLTVQNAVKQAELDMHRQVLRMRLTPDRTIGQAMEIDPPLKQIVDRCIRSDSHIEETDLRADGGAVVHLTLDLHLLWGAIGGGE